MIVTRIEDLEDTYYNQTYGTEIIRKSIKKTRIDAKLLKIQELEWLVYDNKEWTTFTITVTFQNIVPVISNLGMKGACFYELEKGVFTKIRKRLCRLQKHWDQVLKITDFCVYEFEQGSFFKAVPNDQSPHHIHGLFPVPNHLASRIYDFTNRHLDMRLNKDLRSMHTVSTFHLEPIRLDEAGSWYKYMIKSKGLDSFVGLS